ncbi:DNA methyltransferase [Actinacidiphila sp. DG2A-62]|uniref:Eco57I restriction-modification methylase domain-containing protein n=1 Tax=Actinacidiphila sp. DG2A-62 TaxID=3108821 RepID=UPI002DB795C2|nr:DNA methyltransferase [Actinacidiphila sp. DG2A-62]MEC3994883.1 DNA methyltransferase [Actinacidiphila sp. DG2A-62]
MSSAPRSGSRRPSAAAIRAAKASDGKQQHLDWLNLVEVSGPFLTLPVLLRTWPQLEGVPSGRRGDIRLHHGIWQDDRKGAGRLDWIGFQLRTLLEWDDALHMREGAGQFGDGGESLAEDDTLLDRFAVSPPGSDTTVRPDFALVRPGTDLTAEPNTAAASAIAEHVPILGLVLPPDTVPTRRIRDDSWAASGVDRLAHVLRHHGVELGLVTDGRWWSLVWAPPGGVTTSATFDTIAWNEAADLVAVRAWVSLLRRGRFFGRPADELLPALLRESLDGQEDVTEALGIQVRQAVELLVDSIGRAEARMVKRGGKGLSGVPASEVYRGAIAVMMRVVFLLFAEERGLLPADNELYAEAYSVGRLYETLDKRRRADGEDSLEHTTAAWHRLIALFHAVHGGVDHPLLTLPAYDGSIFDPTRFPWLEAVPEGADGMGDDPARASDGQTSLLPIDDRTVLHVLDSVQFVVVNRERRRLTFRALDVEQIGYVYEGLLSYDGKRAQDTVLGLIGKPGLEHEVRLTDLEELAAPFGVGARAVSGQKPNLPGLSKKLYEHLKDPKPPAAVSKMEKLLAPGDDQAQGKAVHRLLAVTENDRDLAERILPFHGLLRDDLRGLPVVIPEDGLYVTESRLRKNSGTHYTPRDLAQKVAVGALEPLVYRPGPLQTADDKQWKLIKAEDILKLKVADIAMGSAAFLVAACRYLADRLVDAWVEAEDEEALAFRGSHRDQTGAMTAADAESDPVMVRARRLIIEHCLYGVDINPMAVEMAKLSLWLISMDPERPFTFLDDRLVAGDSLLGIANLEQIESVHLDPKAGRKLHRGAFEEGWTERARARVHGAADNRQAIAGINSDTIADLEEKRRLLAATNEHLQRLRLIGDLTTGAGLASAGGGDSLQNATYIQAAELAGMVASEAVRDSDPVIHNARTRALDWLSKDLPSDGFVRLPVHWPLVFPEVFEPEQGGFDAIIGNPPFLGGQKLTGTLGQAYREYLVLGLGRGQRGSADLVAYFELRAHQLLSERGQTGLIATNTLAQGDTREVGLDQLLDDGIEVRRAVKSARWPSKSAALEYCAVWTTRPSLGAEASRVLDDVVVRGITSSLDPRSRVSGRPYRLVSAWAPGEPGSGVANRSPAFIGSYVLGKGFILTPEQADDLIQRDPRNKDVLFPYLNGEDLNSRPDCSASRWVINFHDWSEERARSYPDVFAIVERDVKPERLKNNRKVRRERWWQYAERAPKLYQAIKGLDCVLVVARVSKTGMPLLIPTGQVMSEQTVVFATDRTSDLALLSSGIHFEWAISRASTLETRVRYTPSDVYETFPEPASTPAMEEAGLNLHEIRRSIMGERSTGLTKVYNLYHDPRNSEQDIVRLRAAHESANQSVLQAYGWTDLDIECGFHQTPRGLRYTFSPAVQAEILDRILELNHDRHHMEPANAQDKGNERAMGSGERGSPSEDDTLF